jgi:WD40-like Beta Propeller Repeat
VALPSHIRRAIIAGLGLGALLLASPWAPAPAGATSPGTDGAIAFVRGGDVWAIDADGTDERRLTLTPEREHAPAWSPDGARIAFGRGELIAGAGAADVWVARADGSAARQVTSDPAPETEPGFAPGGAQIVFTRLGPGACESTDGLVVRELATGSERILAVGGAREADWSPAGDRVAFTLDPGCNDPAELRLIPAAGGAPAPLPGDPALAQTADVDDGPSWSPDGASVALRSLREECVASPQGFLDCRQAGGVAVRPVDAPAPRQVLIPDGAAPAFSPSGRRIAFARAGDLVVRDLRTGAERRLTGDAGAPAWQNGEGLARVRAGAADVRARARGRARVLRLAGARRLRLLASADGPRLAWRERAGASAYRVRLLRAGRPVFTRVTAAPRTPLPARLRPGNYRLLVWAARPEPGARRFAGPPILWQRIEVRLPPR